MTLALGTPQRGQMMAPAVGRLAMDISLSCLDCTGPKKDSLRGSGAKLADKLNHISR